MVLFGVLRAHRRCWVSGRSYTLTTRDTIAHLCCTQCHTLIPRSTCHAAIFNCSLAGYLLFGSAVTGNVLNSFADRTGAGSDNLMGFVRLLLPLDVWELCLRSSDARPL